MELAAGPMAPFNCSTMQRRRSMHLLSSVKMDAIDMDKIRHPRRCVVGALAGALAACALVIAVSFVLRPAPLVFSVTDARSSKTAGDRGVFLNFTLVADNPSCRAAVEYETLVVMLWYGNTEYLLPNTSLADADAAAPASATAAPLLLQPPCNKTAVEVTALTLDDRWIKELDGNQSTSTPFNVLVAAQVKFRFGRRLHTRPYNVRVSCANVYFFANSTKSIDCYG